jgi:hypothetical protein
VVFEPFWFAANFHRNPGLEAQSFHVGHNSTKFLKKSNFPEISSLPDYRKPGTSVIFVQRTPGWQGPVVETGASPGAAKIIAGRKAHTAILFLYIETALPAMNKARRPGPDVF